MTWCLWKSTSLVENPSQSIDEDDIKLTANTVNKYCNKIIYSIALYFQIVKFYHVILTKSTQVMLKAGALTFLVHKKALNKFS